MVNVKKNERLIYRLEVLAGLKKNYKRNPLFI